MSGKALLIGLLTIEAMSLITALWCFGGIGFLVFAGDTSTTTPLTTQFHLAVRGFLRQLETCAAAVLADPPDGMRELGDFIRICSLLIGLVYALPRRCVVEMLHAVEDLHKMADLELQPWGSAP